MSKSKTINQWLNDDEREPGVTSKNVQLLREYKEFYRQFARMASILTFLTLQLQITSLRHLMTSVIKQRRFLNVVCNHLKQYKIAVKYDKAFVSSCQQLRSRLSYVTTIALDNLRLTEYFPYLEAEGFDRIDQLLGSYNGEDSEELLQTLLPEMQAWNDAHPDEIKAHLDSIREENETHQAYRDQVIATTRAEIDLQKYAKDRARHQEEEALKDEKKKRHDEAKLNRALGVV